ncbi:MAG TPA: DUF998 domain-containing protein [Thermomicrobiales bacterium]|nr:DUF998 domain-containing protein [Thermomicrobiales bacterium]
MSFSTLSSGPRDRTQVVRIATVALIGIICFSAIIVVLHVLRSDDPVRQPTSAYAVGEHGYLMTSAFLSVSLASMALIVGLYRGVSDSARSQVGLGLLGIWAVGVLVAMIFPIDLEGAPRTTASIIHRVTGPIAFLSLSMGAILVSRRFKDDASWRPLHRVAVFLAVAMLAAFIVTGLNIATDSGYMGIFQRMVLVTFVTWFALVATRLLMLASASDDTARVSRQGGR